MPNNFLRLAEVRGSIGVLATQEVGTFVILHTLQGALAELGIITKNLLRPTPKKKRPPVIDAVAVERTSTPSTTEEVKKQVKLPTPPATVSHRRPSASSTYHADRYLPYRILWTKVIIRAMYDYALWKDSKDVRLRKFAQDAARWFFEPSNLELSFENICFAFDFPVEKVRQRARALTRQDVKKLEHRERQGRPEALVSPDGDNG